MLCSDCANAPTASEKCKGASFCAMELPESFRDCPGLCLIDGDLTLPRPDRFAHKGDFGRVLLLGGSLGYTGAPSMASHAATRAGAGLVWLGVPSSVYTVEAIKNEETMVFALETKENGLLTSAALTDLRQRISSMDAIAAGPGAGKGLLAYQLTELLLTEFKGPLVLDADCLNVLAENRDWLKETTALPVLTPHAGEFLRLYPEAEGNPPKDAAAFAAKFRCVLVLKGHRTLIAFPDGRLYAICAGNPGMAKGGSGDVLTGILGAMLGRMDFDKAILAGCWLHARAGDLAAERFGEYGMLPTDIIDNLPFAQKEITEE